MMKTTKGVLRSWREWERLLGEDDYAGERHDGDGNEEWQRGFQCCFNILICILETLLSTAGCFQASRREKPPWLSESTSVHPDESVLLSMSGQLYGNIAWYKCFFYYAWDYDTMTQVVYLSNEKDSSETANKIQTDSIGGIRTGGSNVRPEMAWQKLVFTFKYILQVSLTERGISLVWPIWIFQTSITIYVKQFCFCYIYS